MKTIKGEKMSRIIINIVIVLGTALLIKPAWKVGYKLGQKVGLVINRFLDWRDESQLIKQAQKAGKLV